MDDTDDTDEKATRGMETAAEEASAAKIVEAARWCVETVEAASLPEIVEEASVVGTEEEVSGPEAYIPRSSTQDLRGSSHHRHTRYSVP